MSKTRYVLDTPIGRVRSVFIAGTRYYMIKDVCAGIGLSGHSPWSWHAKEKDNKERFYRRYDLARDCPTSKEGRKNTTTIITYAGLMDYLCSATIIKKPQAIMFRTWLEAQASDCDKAAPKQEDRLPLEQAIAEEMPVEEIAQADEGPCWMIAYTCSVCGCSVSKPSKFCPDCGLRLMR